MDHFDNELEEILKQANEKMEDLNMFEKYEYMFKNNHISVSSVQRLFGYSYPKALNIIKDLIYCGAIAKMGNKYIVVSSDKFLDFARSQIRNEKVLNKKVSNNGEKLISLWNNLFLCKFLKRIDTDNFTKLIEETHSYFKKLNNISSLLMNDKEKISFSVCLKIIVNMYNYSNNQKFDADVDYNEENLDNYPEAKQQLAVKATQLLTESLIRELSCLPIKPLDNIIGVIYNGGTFDYNVEKKNIEELIKFVAANPYSET